jgi:hypothetical protein
MKSSDRVIWLTTGFVVGILGVGLYLGQAKPALASNDRYEDYILCTGTVAVTPRALTDGVWLLDYRAGKLLGTVIDRGLGKIVGWAELDLASEFNIAPRQNAHFLMTTGTISQNQAALYLAETVSGKFGIYTMGARTDGQFGLTIRRHDLSTFRQPPKGIDPANP